jgi:hypothetical protein
LGFEFDNPDLAYSVLNGMIACGVIVFSFIEPQITTPGAFLAFAIVISVVAVVFNGIPFFFPYHDKNGTVPKTKIPDEFVAQETPNCVVPIEEAINT